MNKTISDAARGSVANAPLDLERFLPIRISVLGNRLTRAVARVYAQRFHMTAPEWRTMAVLGRYGAMTSNGVAEYTAMDKVRVSRAVARLLASDRITRDTDPQDRRRAILDLSTEGRAVYEQIVPLALAVEAELVSSLTAEERAVLDDVIRKLEAQTEGKFADIDIEV
jgi:DNA-binding MarR family transcriptional regulator